MFMIPLTVEINYFMNLATVIFKLGGFFYVCNVWKNFFLLILSSYFEKKNLLKSDICLFFCLYHNITYCVFTYRKNTLIAFLIKQCTNIVSIIFLWANWKLLTKSKVNGYSDKAGVFCVWVRYARATQSCGK